jgi:hypothetical protein
MTYAGSAYQGAAADAASALLNGQAVLMGVPVFVRAHRVLADAGAEPGDRCQLRQARPVG